MAKKTKDSNLSLEEKLEQALIPNWDEPYKLPDNWCWVNLGTICSLENGVKQSGEELVYLDAKTLREINEPQFRDNGVVVVQNQKVILVDGENSGEVFIVPYRGYMGSTFRIINISKCSDEMYVRYFIDFNRDKLRKNKVGSAIPHLNKELFFSLEFPFPPLSEQQRIVARIESLFAKLDEAKEKAQEVVDGFETRKAAILHKAFSGELTQKWREENGVGLDAWTVSSIDELCHSLKYGTSKKSKSEGPVVVIRMGNLQQGEIDWSDLAYTDDQEDIEKYKLNPGDVLFNRTNSAVLVGKTSIYRGEFPAIFAGYLIKLDYDHECILGEYLNYSLNTTAAKEYCNSVKTDGVNQSNINAKKIGAFEIPVAPLSEQKEIVRIIKSLLEKENQSKETAETVIEQIDTMKKAILARAFRGELGTNDPSEESAIELLKQIISK